MSFVEGGDAGASEAGDDKDLNDKGEKDDKSASMSAATGDDMNTQDNKDASENADKGTYQLDWGSNWLYVCVPLIKSIITSGIR